MAGGGPLCGSTQIPPSRPRVRERTSGNRMMTIRQPRAAWPLKHASMEQRDTTTWLVGDEDQHIKEILQKRPCFTLSASLDVVREDACVSSVKSLRTVSHRRKMCVTQTFV